MEEGKQYFYHTEVIGKARVQDVQSDYKITIKNEVIYKGIFEGLHRFIVKETSYELDQYENPLVMQITEMTNKICSIYKTLDIGVSSTGTLKKVYNRKEIKEKWADIREWLMNAHPLESYNIIRAKEFELSNEEMEMKNIGFIHFLYQYFFIFGRKGSQASTSYIRRDEMDRFGAGVVIPVTVGLNETIDKGIITRKVDSKMIRDENVIHRLREFSKNKYMHPEYIIKGQYTYEGGLLTGSDLTITEELGEHYYNHSYLNLKLEEHGG